MIKELQLEFGHHPGAKPLSFRPGTMTVVVGPNGTGKSMLLREMAGYLSGSGTTYASRSETLPSIFEAMVLALPSPGPLRNSLTEKIRELIAEGKFNVLNPSLDLWPTTFEDDPETRDTVRVLTASQCVFAAPKRGQFTSSEILGRYNHNQPTFRFGEKTISFSPSYNELMEGLAALGLTEADLASPDVESALIDRLVDKRYVELSGLRDIISKYITVLNGHNRLLLIAPRPVGNLYQEPANFMMALREQPEKMERLRGYVREAFGFELAIDILDMKHARFVAADQHPGEHEQSFTQEARDYFRATRDLQQLSDGVKSFVGIHATLLSADHRVIFIDEPEAFLHPPLARRLGKNLTRLAAERGASVFAATHSADFLQGCVEAGHDIHIVRLGYHYKVPTARILAAEELRPMMLDPLLRTTGVLRALFHRGAIVCEGDSDAAFYEEINERLRHDAEERGNKTDWARDSTFITSHCKETVPRLMGCLRTMGIPAAAVVDLDLLKGKTVVRDLLEEAGASESIRKSIGSLRSDLEQTFKKVAEQTVPGTVENRAEALRNERDKLMKRGGIDNLSDPHDRQTTRVVSRATGQPRHLRATPRRAGKLATPPRSEDKQKGLDRRCIREARLAE